VVVDFKAIKFEVYRVLKLGGGASSREAIYDNGVGNGLFWSPVTSLSGVGVVDFRVEITM
jgi:hypothetical protein